MKVQTALENNDQDLVIRIVGRFDFSTHQVFREAYEKQPESVRRYVIDMSETSYLDSSALGMLLLLRDYAGGESAAISIVNCNTDVRKILTISNFEQLFEIK
tara:strand:+ start:518 stop:823 length:306 start_codon:yes stop_codon:yes gene_type:complete